MTYLLVYAPFAFYVLFCVASAPTIYSLGIAVVSVASGVAAVLYRRSGLLGLSTASALILYFLTALPQGGPMRLLQAIALGSSLFLYVDLSHDLIVLRIRRIPYAAIAPRVRSIAGLLAFSASLSIVVVVLGANTVRYLPTVARVGLGVPAIAALVGGFVVYVHTRSRNR